MARPTLSNREARALALRAQGFGRRWSARRPIDVLERLGDIQLDSVNVVQRTHWIVPFSRLGAYPIELLHKQVYGERGAFEYWGHEASWLPIGEYRYFRFRLDQMRAGTRGWWGSTRDEHAELYRHVLDRIRAEGPLGSAAFEDPRAGRGTWWDWKPAKRVLEDLFDQGYLMCRERTAGFARIYDLPERVLPPGLDTSDPGVKESARHLMRRSFEAMGVATLAEAADYFRLKPAEYRPALASLLEEGALIRVEVEGWRQAGYALASSLAGSLRIPRHRPTVLSPFDNLIWERQRTERLFNFRYRIEIYTPAPKRQFGYYVLPLLIDGRLAGRADLKLDRPARLLRVRRVAVDGAALETAQHALADYAAQLGAERYEVEQIDAPPGSARPSSPA